MDYIAPLFFAVFVATFVVVMIEGYENRPDWWK